MRTPTRPGPDPPALERLEARLRDLEALEKLTRQLGAGRSVEDLVVALSHHSETVLGTLNVAVVVCAPDDQDLLVYQGPHPAHGTTTLRAVERSADTPAGLSAITGREGLYVDPTQIATRFPKLAQRMGADRVECAATFPLDDDGSTIGAIWYRWSERVDFDDRLLDMLRRTTTAFAAAINHQRHSAEQNRRLEELLQANRELESLSAAAAHDLKAPLRRVHSFVQLLEDEVGSSDPSAAALRYAAVIRAQVDDMASLVDDLLVYSAANRSVIEHEAVALREVMTEVCRTLQPVIATERAHVEIGDLPVVKGDRGLLTQLFVNLVDNAVKYHHPDRAPLVTILAAEADHDEHDPTWQLTVADNGIGVQASMHEKIFQIFERGEVADRSGTGIGLAIAKRVVERHGGRLWLVSEPGSGSSFHLTLPGAVPVQEV